MQIKLHNSTFLCFLSQHWLLFMTILEPILIMAILCNNYIMDILNTKIFTYTVDHLTDSIFTVNMKI